MELLRYCWKSCSQGPSPTTAAPSSVSPVEEPLQLLLPLNLPLLKGASPVPKAFNSVGMRPRPSPGALRGGHSQLCCWHCVPRAEVTSLPRADGMREKQCLHQLGKHQCLQSSFFLKRKKKIYSFSS